MILSDEWMVRSVRLLDYSAKYKVGLMSKGVSYASVPIAR